MKQGVALRASLMGPALSLLAAAPAAAGSSTGQFRVTLTIQAECKLTVANDMDTTGDIQPAINADGSIGAPCSNSAPYNIGLNAGSGSGSTVAVRMVSATAGGAVNYMIYRDAVATQIWGDTISANTLAATGNGAVQTFTVYGRVPAQTTPAAGNYSNTVQVVITY